ncbi:hypothetical protein LPJ77_003846 [Coemansia sp. RSA 2523]|nr:hypothetical protein LPJ58_006632 [Coemansia sp. RSA 1591]KAJ1788191.1 hypothetical protein LPJ62_002994 [Coemansia sp. RSA 2167]KAJ1806071.1 hypothetical protein LPJ77_003846 [Coemansia sp. RSA 2523]KAJ2145961.1 hypothetical protein IW142_002328 [Coemansia sp. RSA 564]KAJ2148500.1 hypothetical protein J3F82_004685 [Coemansia sp. RSA 637]KAJ2164154.1 hypothetical protein GGH15_004078 [Coemansia sp. RSA 562]KAJ2175723.1 hypothetical protein GGF45_003799 [Coemansia sp. RSA 551]KAJ2190724.1 
MFSRVLSRAVAVRTVGRRFESTLKVGDTTVASRPAAPKPKKRPIGGFRGGVVGFLLGVTSAGALGFVYLIDEYQKATSLVLGSVAELEKSSLQVKNHVQKIEAVERTLEQLKRNTPTVQQLQQARADWRKQNDILTRDHLELKAHVWELEQDVESVLKRSKSAK